MDFSNREILNLSASGDKYYIKRLVWYARIP